MLKRTKPPNFNRWTSIGGKVEINKGESPHDCAIREVFEETLLTVNIESLVEVREQGVPEINTLDVWDRIFIVDIN